MANINKSEGYKLLLEIKSTIIELIETISETQAEHVDRHMLSEWSDELKYLVTGDDRTLSKAVEEYTELYSAKEELEQEKSSLEDNLTSLYETNDNLTSIIDTLEHQNKDLQKEVQNYQQILNQVNN